MAARRKLENGARGQMRQERPVVLIVCEGETEEGYFRYICPATSYGRDI